VGSFRFRRSIKLGPGVRLNVGKTGIPCKRRGSRRPAHVSLVGAQTSSLGIPGNGLGLCAYEERRQGERVRADRSAAADGKARSVRAQAREGVLEGVTGVCEGER
jgi:Protein of unknown function (DUF4236)